MGLLEDIGGLSFSVLGSSSAGNCTLVTDGETTILLDAGLPVRFTASKVLQLTGKERVDGIFISHEHSDHTRNLFPLARRYSCPVYLSAPVSWYLGENRGLDIREIKDGCPVRTGTLTITPFLVPHDAISPFGFIVDGKETSMGLVTDLGAVDERIVDLLSDREGLVIESNHDVQMLQDGIYPAYLKKRIMDGNGHLSNKQCRDLLDRIVGPRTRDIVLVHLSEENNDPLLALETSMEVLRGKEGPINLHVSYPMTPTELYRLYR
ncbi:MAG: MBL fold metallo-hydrolase [Candidatus Thermoplasmatota archaeon]|nr:MBL fold metallo-hydrolase [Candidatus Thermoplasmatota archaeon]